MKIKMEEKIINLNEIDAAVFAVYSDKLEEQNVEAYDKFTKGQLKNSIANKEFSGKKSSMILFRVDEKKVLVVGLGEYKSTKSEMIKVNFANAIATLRELNCKIIGIEFFESNMELQMLSRSISEGIVISSYSFDRYKTLNEEKKKEVEKVIFYYRQNEQKTGIQNGIELGEILGNSINYSRSLANEPANIATPEFVSARAKELCSDLKIKIEVFGKKELENMGANALLAVSSGSVKEPQLIHMEYDGRKNGTGKTIAVVGKGITFDSGGISIKPAMKMEEMKFDKSGACAVLGIMHACVKLKVNAKVIGICALSENLPSGSAYKPSDIVKTMSGKTVEVQNTDAEGRMVLSDAITYANKFKPDYLVDLATLTGACVIALGDLSSGLFSNDEDFENKLKTAGEISGERLWPLPVWPEYDEKIKSDVADIKNVGEGPYAGAIAGASFLKTFAEPTKWAHLDIAGTAWVVKPKGYFGSGATGVGVRVVTQFIIDESANQKH